MDSYQPIYDAARSRISSCDVGSVVADAAFRAFDISHIKPLASEAIGILTNEMTRPSVLFRPRLLLDGNSWCALYGDNLQDGVAGFGDSPDAACVAFDKAWSQKR